MFSSTFQGGEAGLEIFSPAGNDPFKLMKLQNESNIIKIYDRNIKGYMIALDKESSSTSIHCPGKQRDTLGITQPLLIFQLFTAALKSFSLEIVIVDQTNQRRRLHFSTNCKLLDCNGLHCRIPWDCEKDIWMNLVFDLEDLVDHVFKNTVQFQALESFTIHPVCRIRKIFTMQRKSIVENTIVLVPVVFDFPPGVDRVNVVFNLLHLKQPVVRPANDSSKVSHFSMKPDVLSLKSQNLAKVRSVSRSRLASKRPDDVDPTSFLDLKGSIIEDITESGDKKIPFDTVPVSLSVASQSVSSHSDESRSLFSIDHDTYLPLLEIAASVLCRLEFSLTRAEEEYVRRHGKQAFALEVEGNE
jgi:hypothetical protein